MRSVAGWEDVRVAAVGRAEEARLDGGALGVVDGPVVVAEVVSGAGRG